MSNDVLTGHVIGVSSGVLVILTSNNETYMSASSLYTANWEGVIVTFTVNSRGQAVNINATGRIS